MGKYEIYPNEERIRMDDQDICVINIKARILGGMKNRGMNQCEADATE